MIITVICRLCKNIDFEVIFIELIESLAKTPYKTACHVETILKKNFLKNFRKVELSNIITNILEWVLNSC